MDCLVNRHPSFSALTFQFIRWCNQHPRPVSSAKNNNNYMTNSITTKKLGRMFYKMPQIKDQPKATHILIILHVITNTMFQRVIQQDFVRTTWQEAVGVLRYPHPQRIYRVAVNRSTREEGKGTI